MTPLDTFLLTCNGVILLLLFSVIFIAAGKQFDLQQQNQQLSTENDQLARRVGGFSTSDNPADRRLAMKDTTYLERLSKRRMAQLPLDMRPTKNMRAVKPPRYPLSIK